MPGYSGAEREAAGHEAKVKDLKAEVERLESELKKEDESHLHTIDQRDEHEESLNKIFVMAGLTERESEWTSANDPVENCMDKLAELKAELKQSELKVHISADAKTWMDERDRREKAEAEVQSLKETNQKNQQWAKSMRDSYEAELAKLKEELENKKSAACSQCRFREEKALRELGASESKRAELKEEQARKIAEAKAGGIRSGIRYALDHTTNGYLSLEVEAFLEAESRNPTPKPEEGERL